MRTAWNQKQYAGIDQPKPFQQRKEIVPKCSGDILLAMLQNLEIEDALMNRDHNGKPVIEKYETVRLFFDWPLIELQVKRQHFQRGRVNRDFDVGTLLYGACLVLAFFNGIASVIAILLMAIFWAATAPTRSAERVPTTE